MATVSCSWLTLPSKMRTLSLTSTSSPANSASLSFSRSLSYNVFSEGCLSLSTLQSRSIRHSVVCDAAPKRKADSAAKRARQAEKRRVYNKARKSEIKTRMKKATYGDAAYKYDCEIAVV
ncbi:30S ribosomal protein S20, chloroplastic-like [Neltuma alba]|uniref:30S ribosomal protein S20, chloroplastic-like n=1 Tax=Neltuma alba TaxID=207710 RepID=UPI0010A2CB7D|nr:30S ribosomal protein S20, chloroplastic-like [Prosopis alba]